jgi:hypothetical protein
MKLLFLSATVFFISFTINAKDACSSQVKSYVSGLETGAAFAVVDNTQREKAIKQIDYIQNLQKTLPDCKVVDFIPELKATKEALKFATEKIKK